MRQVSRRSVVRRLPMGGLRFLRNGFQDIRMDGRIADAFLLAFVWFFIGNCHSIDNKNNSSGTKHGRAFRIVPAMSGDRYEQCCLCYVMGCPCKKAGSRAKPGALPFAKTKTEVCYGGQGIKGSSYQYFP